MSNRTALENKPEPVPGLRTSVCCCGPNAYVDCIFIFNKNLSDAIPIIIFKTHLLSAKEKSPPPEIFTNGPILPN